MRRKIKINLQKMVGKEVNAHHKAGPKAYPQASALNAGLTAYTADKPLLGKGK